jgi:hypothetical protein
MGGYFGLRRQRRALRGGTVDGQTPENNMIGFECDSNARLKRDVANISSRSSL